MIKQLAPVQKQDIIENHYLNNEYRVSQEDMGSLYGVSARTIYRVLREAGIASRKYTRALAAHPPQTVTQTVLAAVPADPHAELRKTWKKGQQWQYRWNSKDCWRIYEWIGEEPRWAVSLEYRRDPDDLASEQVPPALGDSVPADIQQFINNCSLKELSTILQARTKARRANSTKQYAT